MTTLAILTAAGSGTRLGRPVPKALVEVEGVPMVVHAARNLAASGVVDAIVVTAPAGLAGVMSDVVARGMSDGVGGALSDGGAEGRCDAAAGCRCDGAAVGMSGGAGDAMSDGAAGSMSFGSAGGRSDSAAAGRSDGVGGDAWGDVPVRVVEGGATRQESVAAGLALASEDVDVVLVHDAARPFASSALVRRVVAAVRDGHSAVVPGLPVADTIKTVAPPRPTAAPGTGPTAGPVAGAAVEPIAGPSAGRVIGAAEEPGTGPTVEPVTGTPERSTLRAVQTPQGFDRALLERAHAAGAARAADAPATDDAGLVEALGEPVVVVPGEDAALKITTERDLLLAALLDRPATSATGVAS